MKLGALVTLSILIGTGVFSSGCSAAPEEDDGSETSEGELRVLGADEVVGSIAFGTSAMEVEHPGETSSRRVYRALKVEANKGDVIEARALVGNAADPVLYVLGSNFRTLKSNDDERAGEKSSLVSYKATRTGTHYLAFRTKEGWRTKFYVSLRGTNGPTNPPVDPPVDPPSVTSLDVFAPTNARDLTASEVTALFTAGASARVLGNYRLVERRRTCNELTGCTEFTADTTSHRLSGYVTYPSTSWRAGIADGQHGGATTLNTTSDGFRITMGEKSAPSEFFIGPCELALTAMDRCRAYTHKSVCSSGGTYCSEQQVNVKVLDNDSNVLAFDMKLTADFVLGRSKVYKSAVSSSREYTEAQYAFVASTKGKTVAFEPTGETIRARFQ